MPSNRNSQGTGFVNYNDILNANQQSGARMGQAVAGGLESQGQAVNQSLQNQQNEFQQGLGQSQTDWSNQSALAKQLAGYGNQQDWTNIANTQSTTPDVAGAGTNFRNYNYAGPTGLTNASGLQTQAQSASNAGRLAGTTQGQQQLLGQYVGGQGYTGGQSQFDQALLNKYGRGQITQASKGLVGLGQQADNAISGSQTAAQNQASLVQNQKQDYTKGILNSLYGGTAQGGAGSSGGVLGLGQQQKNIEQSDIDRLNQLLSSNTAGVKNITPNQYTQHDKDLLNSMGQRFNQYGVDTSKQYYNTDLSQDQLAALNGVQKIGNDFSLNGNYLLKDPNQRASADVLSGFLGQSIAPNQYTDLSKTYTGNLGNTIESTVGKQKSAEENKITGLADKEHYWDPNRDSGIGWGTHADTWGTPKTTQNQTFKDMNNQSIAEGFDSLYTNPGINAQLQQRAQHYTDLKNLENSRYGGGTNRTLMDYLNGQNTDPVGATIHNPGQQVRG